jgi:hypothetical protein
MKFIEDMENPGKWVDENYDKIPPSIGTFIEKAIKDYLDKYEHAEYMSKDCFDEMIRWKRSLSVYKKLDD